MFQIALARHCVSCMIIEFARTSIKLSHNARQHIYKRNFGLVVLSVLILSSPPRHSQHISVGSADLRSPILLTCTFLSFRIQSQHFLATVQKFFTLIFLTIVNNLSISIHRKKYMVKVTRNLCVVTTLELYLSQSILCVERTKSPSNQHIRFDVCDR
jgi:hypothetical protein